MRKRSWQNGGLWLGSSMEKGGGELTMIYRTHNLTGGLVVLKSEASMRQFLRDRQRSVESKLNEAQIQELIKAMKKQQQKLIEESRDQ